MKRAKKNRHGTHIRYANSDDSQALIPPLGYHTVILGAKVPFGESIVDQGPAKISCASALMFSVTLSNLLST